MGRNGGAHSLYARDLQAPLVQEAHRLPGERGLRPSRATLCLTVQLFTQRQREGLLCVPRERRARAQSETEHFRATPHPCAHSAEAAGKRKPRIPARTSAPRDPHAAHGSENRLTYRSFVDAEGIECHSGKEFTIVAPPKRKKRSARLPTRRHRCRRGHHESTEKCQAVPVPVRPPRADYLLENRPVGRAFTVKASLLLPSKDVPDDDGLRVVLSVHQGAEGHQVSVTERTRVPISSHRGSHQRGHSRNRHPAAVETAEVSS